jgi:hypothetical protein
MKQSKKNTIAVDVYEYERGWGSKVDFTEWFPSREKAVAYATKFNSKNTETVVPDWYMVARLRGE